MTNAERKRAWCDRMRQEGRCIACGAEKECRKASRCNACLETARSYNRRRAERAPKHPCSRCGAPVIKPTAKLCVSCCRVVIGRRRVAADAGPLCLREDWESLR